MEKIGVGIIGAGHMGETHARILSRDRRVRVVGVCDGVKERAESLARRCDAKTYLNYRDLVKDRNVSAVYVTTPSAHHVEPVMHAVRCGKHIFSEKPMSTSLESSKGIVEVVEESDVKYQVGHNRRFCPVYKRVKKLVVKHKVIP